MPATALRGGLSTEDPKPADKSQAKALSITDVSKILRRLTGTANGIPTRAGYVCSEPWARECWRSLADGRTKARDPRHLERDLHKSGVYPPGGGDTAMVEDEETMRYLPPDITGTGVGVTEDSYTLSHGCKMPPSPSAAAIEAIRASRSKPVGGQW